MAISAFTSMFGLAVVARLWTSEGGLHRQKEEGKLDIGIWVACTIASLWTSAPI